MKHIINRIVLSHLEELNKYSKVQPLMSNPAYVGNQLVERKENPIINDFLIDKVKENLKTLDRQEALKFVDMFLGKTWDELLRLRDTEQDRLTGLENKLNFQDAWSVTFNTAKALKSKRINWWAYQDKKKD